MSYQVKLSECHKVLSYKLNSIIHPEAEYTSSGDEVIKVDETICEPKVDTQPPPPTPPEVPLQISAPYVPDAPNLAGGESSDDVAQDQVQPNELINTVEPQFTRTEPTKSSRKCKRPSRYGVGEAYYFKDSMFQ